MNERGARNRDDDQWLRATLNAARQRAQGADRSGSSAGASACPDAEMLAAYVEQALDPAERRAVEAHAATCDRCVEALGLIATALETSPDVAADASRERSWWRRWSPWLVPATAAATALGLYLAVRPPGADRFERTPRAQEDSQVARATEPPAEVVARPERGVGKPATDKRENVSAPTPGTGAAAGGASAQAAADRPPTPTPAKSKDEAVQPRSKAAPMLAEQAQVAAEKATTAPAPIEQRPQAPAPADEALAARRDAESKQGGLVEARAPDGLAAWRFGPGLAVNFSRDGGTTWQPAHERGARLAQRALERGAGVVEEAGGTPPRVLAASAPSDSVCWAVGTRGLVLMAIAAPPASTQRPFPELADLVSVSARDERTAIVIARDGRRFETRDGGASWALVP